MKRAIFFPAILLRTLVVSGLVAGALQAQERRDIPPPFGLHWGESSERIEKLLQGAKATITAREQVDGREAWTVEGIVQEHLRRSVFYFRRGQLVEVELQYQNPAWDAAKYDELMSNIRRRVEGKFGTGQLIVRRQDTKGDVVEKLVGYKWNQNNTSLQLFYFSAENPEQTYRTVSVHYKLQQ